MKKRSIEVSYVITLTYDPESKEFKDTLQSYKEVVSEAGDEDDLLKYVAETVIRQRDYSRMIEGVGYVSKNGQKSDRFKHDQEEYSGIDIDDDEPFPEVDFWP